MAIALTSTCMLKCSFGTAPVPLTSLPLPGKPSINGLPAALITDIAPGLNIAPFAMCITQTNPLVAAATAAAMGTPTPAPCVPVPVSPWAPPSPCASVAGVPIASTDSKTACSWGGVIEVVAPLQVIVTV